MIAFYTRFLLLTTTVKTYLSDSLIVHFWEFEKTKLIIVEEMKKHQISDKL